MAKGIDDARSRYSSIAIALHWAIALLVLGNLAGGVMMDGLIEQNTPESFAEAAKIGGIHKPMGILILALTLWRLALRLREDFLPLPAHMASWEIVLARGTHIAFYVLLLALPLTGWAFAVTVERPLEFFGLFPIPTMGFSESARDILHEAHELLGVTAIAIVVLHIVGALKHYFLDKDDVVARMLPFLRQNK